MKTDLRKCDLLGYGHTLPSSSACSGCVLIFSLACGFEDMPLLQLLGVYVTNFECESTPPEGGFSCVSKSRGVFPLSF